MKNLLIVLCAITCSSAMAQFKPTAYDTNTDAVAQAFVRSQIGSQVAQSNFLFASAATNFTLISKQAIPLFYQTNINTGTAYASWPISSVDTNGDFVSVFALGNRHLLTNRALYMIRSSNQGYSWSTPVQIYTNAGVDEVPGYAFGIHQRTGRYILAISQTVVATGLQTNTIIQFSDNQGSSWSPATSFPTFTGPTTTNVVAGTVVTLANDRLCMSYSGFSSTFDVSSTMALISDDFGANWTTNTLVASAVSGFREPNFAYLGGSNVLCIVRRDQAFANQPLIYYQLHSTNNGTSWVVDGPVSLGFTTFQRQPAYLYSYSSSQGQRVVMVIGNRENTFLEARDVSAWDLLNNLTNVWLFSTVERLATICPTQGDGGYGSPIGYGQSGDCIIPYYWAASNSLTLPYQAQIRFASRSANLAQPLSPQTLLYDTSIAGITNSTTETDMVNFTALANTLYGAHSYDIQMTGNMLNNAAATMTNRVRVYFGSTVVFDQIMDATVFGQGTGNRPWRFGVTIKARGSTTNQDINGFWQHGSSVLPTVGLGSINATAFAGGNFLNRVALNSTTNNAIRVTFQLFPASSSLWFDHDLISVTYN